MSRSLYAVIPLLSALLLSGCGTPSPRTAVPDTAAVVEEQSPPEPSAPPEPTCAPADVTPDTPPEPVASYRDGSTYEC